MRQYATEHVSESVMEKADFVNNQVIGLVSDTNFFKDRIIIRYNEQAYEVTKWLAVRLSRHHEQIVIWEDAYYWLRKYGDYATYLGRVNGKYKRGYMPGAAMLEIAKEEADN